MTSSYQLSVPVRIADAVKAALLVTGARTIAILADGLIATISGFVFIGAVIACVTTGTVRLECCVPPGDYFGVLLMTIRAG